MLFKAVYLLGAMECEMLGKKYDSDSKTKVYGPTGNDSWEKNVLVNNEQVNTVFFRIKTAKTKGKEERTVWLPMDCEPWARELREYFKEKGGEPVFPFDRQQIYIRVKKSKVLQGLPKPKRRSFGLDNLRWVREKELKDEYGFGDPHLQAYGIIRQERRRTPIKRLDESEMDELRKEYLRRLCKHPEPAVHTLSKTSEESTLNLMNSASFLGLDTNWSVATCALQLQEVSIKLAAKKIGIDLSKTSVEKILNSKFEMKDFGFNQEYEAFGKEVKRLFNVDMPFLTNPFRKMRVKVLHEGYNPQPEEKEPIVSFTLGLMKKLEDVCNKFETESSSKTHAVDSTAWNPLPKINFKVAQRLLRVLQFPQVGWEAYNDSPYQLRVRIEVHPFLGKKDLHPLSDNHINGHKVYSVYPVEPNSYVFANGCFTLPAICATSDDDLILEIRASVEDTNDPRKGEYKLIPRRWKYIRTSDTWSYHPQQIMAPES